MVDVGDERDDQVMLAHRLLEQLSIVDVDRGRCGVLEALAQILRALEGAAGDGDGHAWRSQSGAPLVCCAWKGGILTSLVQLNRRRPGDETRSAVGRRLANVSSMGSFEQTFRALDRSAQGTTRTGMVSSQGQHTATVLSWKIISIVSVKIWQMNDLLGCHGDVLMSSLVVFVPMSSHTRRWLINVNNASRILRWGPDDGDVGQAR